MTKEMYSSLVCENLQMVCFWGQKIRPINERSGWVHIDLTQLPIKSCLCISAYLHLTHCARECLRDQACVHDAVFRGGWVHLSLCAICSLTIVVVSPPEPPPPSPRLAHLKWQFVKHGPLLACSLSLPAIPCTTAPLPHPSTPFPLHITRFTSVPQPLSHFHTSCAFYIFPLSACLSPSVVLFLSISLICPSVSCNFFFFFFIIRMCFLSVLRGCSTLITPPSGPLQLILRFSSIAISFSFLI